MSTPLFDLDGNDAAAGEAVIPAGLHGAVCGFR